jgi:PAS domain S-box-containing protein
MLHHKSTGATFPFNGPNQPWLGTVGLAVAIGIAYFMAARFGLALRAHTGTSVFWPAAGISVGALIVWGRRAHLPVVAAVLVATIVSNLMIGKNVWLAVAFGVVNAGQALLTATLIERWFGRSFKLGNVPQVLGFLVASAIGSAVAATGATIAVGLIQSTASAFIVWRVWLASCLLGIVTVAPLLVGTADALRHPPPRRELIEGAVGIVMLAALSAFVIKLPQGPWSTALPLALIFPVLLWIAVRTPPVFAAAAWFVVAVSVILSMTFSLGHFGDASTPLADRIIAAQTVVLVGALLTLVLAALFADRRRSEAVLEQSKQRLQLALDGAELGAFSLDLATGRLDCDARTTLMHGHNVPPLRIKEGRRFVHEDDLVQIDAAFEKVRYGGGPWNTEYRVLYPPDHPLAGQTHWIAFEGTVLCNTQGMPVSMLGIARDITQRKRAETLLSESNARLVDALAAGQVMAFEWDAVTRQSLRSKNAADILGFEQEANSSPCNKFLSHVHRDDRASLKKRIRELSPSKPSYALSFRYVGADDRQVWLEETAKGEFDAKGKLLRIKGLTRDITERKRAEERQQILARELDHRVKNVLATVSAVASRTRDSSRSMDAFVAALDGRIKSMAITHELLSHRQWQGLPLRELVRRELAPYAAGSNTDIDGPEVILTAEAGQVMAMVLHELVTNAAKYGALSTKNGRVSIRWRWQLNGSHELAFCWQEHGGAAVVAPSSNSGYGMSLIREAIPYELGGTTEFATTPEGVRCELEIPVNWFDKSSRPCDSETAPQRLSAPRS